MSAEEANSLLARLPLEVSESLLTFLDGKSLSTFALALVHCHDRQQCDGAKKATETSEQELLGLLFLRVGEVAKKKLLDIASFLESRTKGAVQEDNNPIDNHLTQNAVNWIRSVVDFSYVSETATRNRMRTMSENLALMDFLQHSITNYAHDRHHFEWPVWVGQITVDSFVTGSRMRHTARVVLTTPIQSPSFLPGCNLIGRHTPSGIFRCEPYRMVPIPPWGRVRALTREDAQVLRPIAERLENLDQVAVPKGEGMDEVLDIRITSTATARQKLESLSWTPRGSWILQNPLEEPTRKEDNKCPSNWNTNLTCTWQDDTMEMKDDRQYIDYIIALLKALERMAR